MKSALGIFILWMLCAPLSIGMPAEEYRAIFADDLVTDGERKMLYENYYRELPQSFTASATFYGEDRDARAELLTYGAHLRQQMWRGWVLIGSGKYGYHPELKENLRAFAVKYYGYKNPDDILLSKQASPLYFYFADGGIQRINRDEKNQPIAVAYTELNARQKRIYDLTAKDIRERQNAARFFATIAEQSGMTPEQALASGKYIGIVSAKSVNDFGRRFLFYKDGCFVGVVIVGGEAKRDDWVGFGSPTSRDFMFYRFPLIIRTADGDPWAFDLPRSIYEHYGGEGGPVSGIYAIDPDREE